jgi:hypothetical protein
VKHCGHPAAYVVADLAGAEWFVCEHHGDPAIVGARWIVRTRFAEWFQARALAVPPEGTHLCNEAQLEVH